MTTTDRTITDAKGNYIGGPTRRKVLALFRAGVTQADIGRTLGITPQAVGQHVAALRDRGVLK